MNTEINCRVGKASGTFARLTERVWDNTKLTIHTRSAVYRAYFCSTMSTMQVKKINTFRQRCLRRILRISWQHKITNEEVLRCTGFTTMYTNLSQRKLCWFGHVLRMSDELVPKSLLYSELVFGKRNVGRLRYKDVCKRELKSLKTFTLMSARNKLRSFIMERLREREQNFLENKRRRLRNQCIYLLFILFFFLLY